MRCCVRFRSERKPLAYDRPFAFCWRPVKETTVTLPVKALAFDTGGTILDWHRGISRALAAAGARREHRRRLAGDHQRLSPPRAEGDDPPGAAGLQHRRRPPPRARRACGRARLVGARRGGPRRAAARLARARCLARLSGGAGAAAPALRRRLVHHPVDVADRRRLAPQPARLGLRDLLRDDRQLQAQPRIPTPPARAGSRCRRTRS